MELQIISPSADGFVKSIEWNHEEIKREVAEKVEYYKTLVYTDDQIKDAKADRATLNKFVKALEDKRKEIKKQCLAPYDKFESEMKEVLAIVNEPIGLIDSQIKGFEEEQKAKKLEEVKQAFADAGFQDFVKFEQVFDNKWLNKSTSMTSIKQAMNDLVMKIGTEVKTINSLPAFSFEALAVYKETLDISKAITEGQRLERIQKEKEAHEEEMKAKAHEAAKQEIEKAQNQPEPVSAQEQTPEPISKPAPRRKRVVLEIVASEEHFDEINNFYKALLEKAESCRIVESEEL
jgi:hypothetical protein